MKRFPFFYLFVFLFMLMPIIGLGQVSDPGCDPTGPLDCDCPGTETNPLCPIDGGLSLLIAAGIGLAAKKAYQQRKVADVEKS